MKTRFTDIHHHLLYGMDDGPRNAEEMRAMLRRANREGISTIVATPHITPGIQPFDHDQFQRALQEARAYCEQQRMDLTLYPGAEILYTDQTCRLLDEGYVPTLAGTDRVLVEYSPDIRFDRMRENLYELHRYGYVPIVAHVERYRCLVCRPARLEEIKGEMEIGYQVNCSTILRKKSLMLRYFLKRILDRNLLDAVATDAHSAAGARIVNLREAWRMLREEFGSDTANELTDGHIVFQSSENVR